jgi:hypothetical protein
MPARKRLPVRKKTRTAARMDGRKIMAKPTRSIIITSSSNSPENHG